MSNISSYTTYEAHVPMSPGRFNPVRFVCHRWTPAFGDKPGGVQRTMRQNSAVAPSTTTKNAGTTRWCEVAEASQGGSWLVRSQKSSRLYVNTNTRSNYTLTTVLMIDLSVLCCGGSLKHYTILQLEMKCLTRLFQVCLCRKQEN